MHFRRSLALLPAGTLVFIAALSQPAQAQSVPGAGERPAIGVVVGVNLANFHGSDASGTDTRTGLVGGVSGIFHLSRMFAIQPELLFAQKGAKISDADAEVTLKLNYLEIPVLARVEFVPATGSVRPFLLAGPSVAFRVGCSAAAAAQGASISVGCDDVFGGTSVSSVDFGAVVGGGLDILMGTWDLSLGARYDHGLASLLDGSNAKNRAVSLIAGVRF